MKKLLLTLITITLPITIAFACAPLPEGSQSEVNFPLPLVKINNKGIFMPDCKTYPGPIYSWDAVFLNNVSLPIFFVAPLLLLTLIGFLIIAYKKNYNLKKVCISIVLILIFLFATHLFLLIMLITAIVLGIHYLAKAIENKPN